MSAASNTSRRRGGFSLIELTTTIAMTGILAVGLANLLQHPMNGYAAVSRRSELVALGDLAIGRLIRDLESALPNSVRVSASGAAIEMLTASGGGRYRASPGINDPGGPGEEDHRAAADWLAFGGDASFNLLGRMQDFPVSHGSTLPAGTRLAIYPTGASVWTDAALNRNPSAITPATSTITYVNDGDEDQFQLSADHTFSLESPMFRVYLVDSPVTYLCDAPGRALWRIDRYAISRTQPTSRATTPLLAGSNARAADLIESCDFTYTPGTGSRAGLVTIELVLETGDERVRLLQQVQVQNAP